jgi:hypothetical protein
MNFKEASSRLTDGYSLADIAEEAGVSEATVRRARLSPDSSASRPPPANWKETVIRMAQRRIASLQELIVALRK